LGRFLTTTLRRRRSWRSERKRGSGRRSMRGAAAAAKLETRKRLSDAFAQVPGAEFQEPQVVQSLLFLQLQTGVYTIAKNKDHPLNFVPPSASRCCRVWLRCPSRTERTPP
jgi:hypothetical protein